MQGFKAIAGWNPQIVKPFCRIYGEKLRPCSLLNLVRQSLDRIAGEQRRRSLVGKAPYHDLQRTGTRYAVKISFVGGAIGGRVLGEPCQPRFERA